MTNLLEVSCRNYEKLLFPYTRILPEKRGLLQALHIDGQYVGVEVNFTHLLWVQQDWVAGGIIDYFKKQGFAMAIALPYTYCPDCKTLTIVKDYISQGFSTAVDKEYNPIPF